MKARLLSIALAICMALSLTPVAYATEADTAGGESGGASGVAEAVATYNGKGYETLSAAVEAVISSETKSGTVVLNKDAEGSGIGLFNAKGASGVNLTIDFGGHTYTCADPAVGSTGTETQGFHLEKGNTVVLKNGAVEVSESSQNTRMLIQNYCDLTLKNIKLTGAGITQYIVSCNYGDMKLHNVDISGSHNNVVAIDLMHWLNETYCDKAPTMSIENDAGNTINGGIDVYCYGDYNGVNADSCTEKPSLTITGGSYTVGVGEFVPDGYSCKQNAGTGIWTVAELEAGSMELESATVEKGTVSATLDGIFDSNGTEIAGGNVDSDTGVSDGDVTVDLSSAEGSEEATGATLTMPADTAKSLANATSLTLKSDVGDVTLDDVALQKIGAEDPSSPVTVSIEEATVDGEGVKAAYTVEVKANGQNLLPFGDPNNGLVTITVLKPEDSTNIQAWYAAKNGDNWVYVNQLNARNIDNGLLSIEIDHLSTIVLTSATPQNQAVAEVVGQDGASTMYSSLDDALSAVALSGGVVNLMKNASMTKGVTISGDVTINGSGCTITGSATDASVNFKVENNGKLTISDVTLEDFGSSAGTNSGIAVIKVESGKTDTKVVATYVNVTDFCRSAYDIRSGEFEITGGTIDCGDAGDGTNSRLTKGILAGLGTGQVSGTVNSVTITNSSSNYEDWNTAGIEIYKNAHVIINDSTITDVENGIHVDNDYSSGGSSDIGAVVKVEGSTVQASNDAIRVYGNGSEGASGTTASITVVGGNFTGDIAVINGAESGGSSAQKETVSVTDATIEGTIDNANGVMGFVDSVITNAGDGAASAPGVTYVNTKVDGTPLNTSVLGKEALLKGVQYETLADAIEAAMDGDVITLLNNVTLDGAGKKNNEGLLTITKDIALNGNGKTIKADSVEVTGESSGPSMINIQDSANVIVRNLIIDGAGDNEGTADNTKHGLNVYGSGTIVTVTNVVIENGNGYGIVVNGAQATIDGLKTSDNGWGGVNVDSKSGEAKLVIQRANISEENSVKIENSATDVTADPSVEIAAGTFRYITTGEGIETPELSISGGTFAAGNFEGAVDISDYVAEGMEWDPATGEVKEEAPVTPGGSGGGVTTPSYDVTIAQPEGGTVSVDPTDAEAGEEVTVTVKPDEGLTLGDLIVTDEDGNTVKVAANEDGTYSFEMPEGDVTITATFVCDGGALCPTDKFTDIDQVQWYHFAIDWVVENGVMKGIGGTTLFAPDDDLLREQAATVMWNIMAEGDLEAPAAALSDVAQGEWYAPYVNWAVEAAVMEGHGGTDRFGVGEALTREQFAAVVAKATKADVSAADVTALEGFTDSESVSEWAQATMAWAVEAGVINGVALSDGTLELQGSREITRAEMAMMIKNAVGEGVLEL